MAKTVLIPTDFTIESLNLLKAAARLHVGSIKVVFYHSLVMNDSIMDLLFFSKPKTIESLVRPGFWEAVKVIRNKYASVIEDLEVDLFFGRNAAAFENFVLGSEASHIVIPKHYKIEQVHTHSDDPLRFIPKCKGIRIHSIHWSREGDIPEKNMLSEIFQLDPELLQHQ